MSTMLVKDADLLITMDDQRRRIRRGGLFVRDHLITAVGESDELPASADVVIDARGMAILPGLVNTHHHFFQTLFRAVPGAQEKGLFEWLMHLFPVYGVVDAEAVYSASLIAMAEMILSGCTTSSDHQYLYPDDSIVESQVRAAREIGMRVHLARGALSLGESQGGLPPDDLVQTDDVILKDYQRVIETYHDPRPFSLLRVILAPGTPFSVTKNLMVQTALLARDHAEVRLHTHVAETRAEEAYCLEVFDQRPAEYMYETGWYGPDVWWAHAIHLNADEMRLLAESGTGVAHCPSSNMRLGSGICPVREMLDAGVNVGIGVDGSASNDCGHVLSEARTAMLLQRAVQGPEAFPVDLALEIATRGGAQILGRAGEIGALQPGLAADFVGVDLDTLAMAGGAVHDPLAALLLCRVDRVNLSVIHGEVIVRDGQLLTVDLKQLIAEHNRIAATLFDRVDGL